jgi:predicted NBD/HSP70 family sugar kinase
VNTPRRTRLRVATSRLLLSLSVLRRLADPPRICLLIRRTFGRSLGMFCIDIEIETLLAVANLLAFELRVRLGQAMGCSRTVVRAPYDAHYAMTEESKDGAAKAERIGKSRPMREVVDAIWHSAPVTQPELVAQTQLSRATVSSVVKRLRDHELVVSVDQDRRSVGPAGGRPADRIKFRRDVGKALCIDIGARHIDVALGDLSGIKDSSSSGPIDVAGDAPAALADAAQRVREIMGRQEPPLKPRDLVGVSVGMPAPIDHHRDQLASSLGLGTWAGIRPARELRRRLGPDWDDTWFSLENDANLRAWSELAFGAARSHSDDANHLSLSLKWSEGIGGAVIEGKHLITGWRGLAGEIGHTVLPDPDPNAPDCPRCGHKCLEVHAGGRALMDSIEETRNGSSPAYFSDLIRRAIADDCLERKLMVRAAERVGQALGYHINLLNPHLVIIGGRPFADVQTDAAAYRLIVDAVRDGWRQTGFPASVDDVDLVMSEGGRLAAALGGVIRVLGSRLPSHLEHRLEAI